MGRGTDNRTRYLEWYIDQHGQQVKLVARYITSYNTRSMIDSEVPVVTIVVECRHFTVTGTFYDNGTYLFEIYFPELKLMDDDGTPQQRLHDMGQNS